MLGEAVKSAKCAKNANLRGWQRLARLRKLPQWVVRFRGWAEILRLRAQDDTSRWVTSLVLAAGDEIV